jgi:hypothetical protein
MLKSILDALPFNNYKSWIGVALAALVLGFQQLGYIPAEIATKILDAIMVWTGVALFHKELKAAE